MRILTITSSHLSDKSGSGSTVLNFSGQLKALGHDLTLVGPDDFNPRLRCRRGVKFRQAFGIAHLFQKLDLSQYDLIEFYGDEYWLVTHKILKLGKRPLIVAHTNGFELAELDSRRLYKKPSIISHAKDSIHRKLSTRFFSKTDVFIALSESDNVSFRSYFPHIPSYVVSPGLAPEYCTQNASEMRNLDLAFTGSWIPRKGITALVVAVEEIFKEKPDILFHVFGTAQEASMIQKDFRADFRHRVKVYPTLTNQELASYLSRTKVFLFPTCYEGYGIALAEAMASGCACIATRTGLGAEIVNLEEAYLVDFNNGAMIAQKALYLLENEGVRIELGKKAIKRALGLTWDRAGIELERVYRTHIKSP